MHSKKKIFYREMKKIKINDFRVELSCVNSFCEDIVDLDELTNCYDNVFLCVLNNHAPVRTKLLKVKRSTPWYNSELRQLKVKRRSLEGKMQKTKLKVD